MALYLMTFAFSVICTYLAEKTIKKLQVFFFLSFCAVSIPALVAGCRDSGVGTDTLIYVDAIWNKMQMLSTWRNFIESFQNGDFSDVEFLYLFLNWFASLFGRDVQWIYFFSSLIIILLVYLSAYDNRKRLPMWFSMSVFFLLYYNLTLNLVRQSIALALCLYSFKYIELQKWWKFILCFALIVNSHKTGIFYLSFVCFYWVCMRTNKTNRKVLLLSIYVLLAGLFLFLDKIIFLVIGLSILPEKFLFYVANDETGSGTGKSALMLNVVILLECWISQKYFTIVY